MTPNSTTSSPMRELGALIKRSDSMVKAYSAPKAASGSRIFLGGFIKVSLGLLMCVAVAPSQQPLPQTPAPTSAPTSASTSQQPSQATAQPAPQSTSPQPSQT